MMIVVVMVIFMTMTILMSPRLIVHGSYVCGLPVLKYDLGARLSAVQFAQVITLKKNFAAPVVVRLDPSAATLTLVCTHDIHQ
jgi:hypothetical protein